jgi:hypothetical protein
LLELWEVVELELLAELVALVGTRLLVLLVVLVVKPVGLDRVAVLIVVVIVGLFVVEGLDVVICSDELV